MADDDALAWVAVSSGIDDIVLATAQGRIARFHEREVRPDGPRRRRRHRHPPGPQAGDQVVGMGVVQPGNDILVLTETGYGKRVAAAEFRPKHRGGQGVRLISLEGAKSGRVAAVELVDETDEELLLISSGGQVVRTDVQVDQPLRQRGPRRHRHAPQRRRHAWRASPSSARACLAARARGGREWPRRAG